MKRKYTILAGALAVSMAVVAAGGALLKEKVLSPYGLGEDIGPVEAPFLMATDDGLKAELDYMRELENEQPEVPDVPEAPEDPETPDTSDEDKQPEAQGTVPTTPPVTQVFTDEQGDTDGQSGIKDQTHTGKDDNPNEPESPQSPDKSAGDDTPPPPETPSEPETPAAPETPAGPATPETPPETPETPDAPVPPAEGEGDPEETVTVGLGGEFTVDTMVDDSWFDDALFIGDSRTVGLRDYARIGDADYFATVGMSVFNVLTRSAGDVDFAEQKLTSLLDKMTYGKVLICLGINECGSKVDTIITSYGKLIDTVREKQPDCVIILQAIMTTGRTKGPPGSHFAPTNLYKINKRIEALAAEKGAYYINVNTAFADSEGYLPSNLSGDGCHLYAKCYPKWVEWIKWAVSSIPIGPETPPVPPDPNSQIFDDGSTDHDSGDTASDPSQTPDPGTDTPPEGSTPPEEGTPSEQVLDTPVDSPQTPEDDTQPPEDTPENPGQ